MSSHDPEGEPRTAAVTDLAVMEHYKKCLLMGQRQRHVTPKGQERDLNTLRAKYLENGWR